MPRKQCNDLQKIGLGFAVIGFVVAALFFLKFLFGLLGKIVEPECIGIDCPGIGFAVTFTGLIALAFGLGGLVCIFGIAHALGGKICKWMREK